LLILKNIQIFLYFLSYNIVLNTKELILLFIFVILFLCTLPTNYIIHGQTPELVHNINITSPDTGQVVPVGNLTMNGTSSDDASTDCQVYADLNNLIPFQNASATGPAGENDYSKWTFTYTKDYHLITNGSNELTANLFCLDNPSPAAISSIDIIGQSPTISDTGTRQDSDDDSKQYSGDDSGQDSREDPFQFVVFCVIVEDYSDEDPDPKDEDPDPKDEDPDPKDEDPDPKDEDPDPKDEDPDPKDEDPEDEDAGNGCGGGGDGNGDGNGDGGDTECKKIIDKNGNGFKDEIEAIEKNFNNHEIRKSC
jgi:hypothetical protein